MGKKDLLVLDKYLYTKGLDFIYYYFYIYIYTFNFIMKYEFLEENAVGIIRSHLSFFDKFSMVVVGGVGKKDLLVLDKYLYTKGLKN